MSLEIIGLIIHPFINVAAFLVILSKITKIKHTRFFVSVCFGLEIIVPFIIAFLGHIFSFSSTIPSYTLSFFLPLFLVWYFCRVEKIKKYQGPFPGARGRGELERAKCCVFLKFLIICLHPWHMKFPDQGSTLSHS